MSDRKWMIEPETTEALWKKVGVKEEEPERERERGWLSSE
jgi:hypothetical protein